MGHQRQENVRSQNSGQTGNDWSQGHSTSTDWNSHPTDSVV